MKIRETKSISITNGTDPIARVNQWVRCLVFFGWFLLSVHVAYGQDTVWVRSPDGSKEIKREGLIVDWTDDTLRMEVNGRINEVSSDRIVSYQTKWPSEYDLAKTEIEKHNFSAAINPLQLAVQAETRSWARHIMVIDLIRSLYLAERYQEAVEAFLVLVVEDPQTRFFAAIPLAWELRPAQLPSSTSATKWLDSGNPTAQLLGASWLLSTNDRAKAIQKLESLSGDIDARIAHLASAQLWRDQVLAPKKDQLDRWLRHVERMPSELRAGPLVVLGLAQQRAQQPDEAILSWMKVLILSPNEYRLAGFALQQSALLLQNEGRRVEAQRLWAELNVNYPQTPWANEAQQAIHSANQP